MTGIAAAAIVGSAVIGGYSANKAAKTGAKAAKDAAAASERSAAASTELQREMYDQTRDDQEPWRNTGNAALNALSLRMGLQFDPVGSGIAQTYDDIYRDVYDEQRDLLSLRYTNRTGKVDTWGLDDAAKAAAAPIAQQRFDAQQASVAAQPDRSQDPNFGALTRDFGMADFEADPGYAFRQAEGLKGIERSAAARGGLLSGAAMKGIERFGQDLASQEYGNAFNRFQSNQNNQYNRYASLAGVGQTANNALGQAGAQFANAFTGISQNNAANQGNAMLAQGNARASGYQGIGNALGGALQNWPQQQPQGYGLPPGYQMGSGYAGNAFATAQGYQPLDHATANAGFYD